MARSSLLLRPQGCFRVPGLEVAWSANASPGARLSPCSRWRSGLVIHFRLPRSGRHPCFVRTRLRLCGTLHHLTMYTAPAVAVGVSGSKVVQLTALLERALG